MRACGWLLAVAAWSAIAACSAQHVPPSGPPVAYLSTRVAGAASVVTELQGPAPCEDDWIVLGSPDRGDWHTVRSGSPLAVRQTVNTLGLPFGRHCDSAVEFLPQEDANYLLEFVLDPHGCRTRVWQVAGPGPMGAATRTPEPSARTFEAPTNCS
jgi:hypothetical protein